jgi:hypothetical protein
MLDIEKLRSEINVLPEIKERFIRLYNDYAEERAISSDWANSYTPLIDARFAATEGYERAQLIAEIGVVLGSIAVLLSMRLPWYASLIFGALCIAQIGMTYAKTEHAVHPASVSIEHAEAAYKELRKQHSSSKSDEFAVDALDPDHKIRNAIKSN